VDSTQIASDIVTASRLQLLVESLIRVERMLEEADKVRLVEKLAPFTRDSAGHYTYRIKGKEAVGAHLQKVGETIYELLHELRDGYGDESAYQVMERLFSENFSLVENQLRVKENTELDSGCLQSVDDLEASYRIKGSKHYRGYVSNITETCDPENELQLVTKVQVAPNNTEDTQLLAEALPNLKGRTAINKLYTDGGYGSPEMDQALQENGVEQTQTAIRGRVPNGKKLGLSDFEIKQAESRNPTRITCPQGQTVAVQHGSKRKGYVAHFEAKVCEVCPLADKCPALKGKRDEARHLRFTQAQMNVSQRRRRNQAHEHETRNLRAAVESTVRQIKHPFPAGKLPVRGLFRVSCMLLGSAMMANVRRIHRHLNNTIRQNQQQNEQDSIQGSDMFSFLLFLKRLFALMDGIYGLS